MGFLRMTPGVEIADSLADALVRREAMMPGLLEVARQMQAAEDRLDDIVAGVKAGALTPPFGVAAAKYESLRQQAEAMGRDWGPLEDRAEAALAGLPDGWGASFVFAGHDYAAFIAPEVGLMTIRLRPAATIPAPEVEDVDGEGPDGDDGESLPDDDTLDGVIAFGTRDGFRIAAMGDSPEDLGVKIAGRPA